MQGGSIWRKWDLHVHTPESFHHEFGFSDQTEREKYKGDIWAKYIDELEKIPDISVLGITDYFSIDGYKKVLDYRKQGRLQNFDLILPNIEFRLDKLVEHNKKINYHVIFSDEVEIESIEGEFLNELHIKTDSFESRSLSRRTIEEVGRTAKDHQQEFKGKSDYEVGCMNIAVQLEEIIKILKNKSSIFGGKHLLVLAMAGWDTINWGGQGYLIKQQIFTKSDAIFSANPKAVSWALGRDPEYESPDDFIKEFGSIKPCIHGSDAHCFDNICKPDLDRFCWIKANPSFEGLRQVVYEPEERVRIMSKNPEIRKNIYTLKSLKISASHINDDLSIDEQEIQLNSNLVAVTGGKGNGKTALLDLIANCFENRCKEAGEDKNSFVQRIEDENSNLIIEIGFTGENVDNFSKKLTENIFFSDSIITYLPQGKIAEFSGDRQKLDYKISEIIFGNKDIAEKGFKLEYDRLKQEIIQINHKIKDINRKIYEIENETKREIISEIEGQRKRKEGERTNKMDELEKIKATIEGGTNEKIGDLKQEEQELRTNRSNFEHIKVISEELKTKLGSYLSDINSDLENLNAELGVLEIDSFIQLLDFKNQLEMIEDIIEVVGVIIQEINTKIEEKKRALDLLTGTDREHAEILKEIEGIDLEISMLDNKLEDLRKKENLISELEANRKTIYLSMLNKYFELKDYYKTIIEAFSYGKSHIMSSVDFDSYIYFDKPNFLKIGSEIMNFRKRISKDDIELYSNQIEEMLNGRDHLEKIYNNFISEIFIQKDKIKSTKHSYEFYNWIWGNYFDLSTKILFKWIPMNKLSMGQKGTVLLKLFLAEGDHPLIIDQPDENLDDKFIYDELVGAFRSGKKKRQIIIATNNANLIVNTDAEQILEANFEDNLISYKLGELEDLKLREEIMPILEGGIEAFKRRERKYGI